MEWARYCALAVFAPQILTLMAGPEFAAGAPALVFIAVAIALAGMTHILRFALVACEKPRFVLIGDSVACACAFAAYFALIPRFSFVGAAIGTVVAESSALIAMCLALRRAGRRLPSLANPGKALVAGALAVLSMRYLITFGIPWLLALAAGGMLYLAALTLTRAIPRQLLLVVLGAARKTGVGHG